MYISIPLLSVPYFHLYLIDCVVAYVWAIVGVDVSLDKENSKIIKA